ncbi:MAG: hypothetical protein KDB80_11060 [Planctomycetes bacterium]|nr:hypothetical protein [Planctomycetota bacterium]
MNLRASLAVILLGWSTAGCGFLPQAPRKLPVNHFVSDPRDFDTVRRVMVLPFDRAPGVLDDVDTIRTTFLSEFAKLGRFEVMPLPARASEHEEIHASVQRGRLSTDALVALSERYQVDGVLIGSVTSYRAYPPMHLGIRLQLVSLHSGRTVWAAEGQYDANDARVVEDVEHYARSFTAAEASMHGWELNLISPQKFTAFVAHRLVATCRP